MHEQSPDVTSVQFQSSCDTAVSAEAAKRLGDETHLGVTEDRLWRPRRDGHIELEQAP